MATVYNHWALVLKAFLERSMEGGEGKEGEMKREKEGKKISEGIEPQIFSFVEVLLNQ